MEIKNCPICDEPKKELLVDINMERFLGNKFKSINITKSICDNCGHIYADKYYDSRKHYEITRDSKSELIYNDENINKVFKKLANWMGTLIRTPKSILDIGCGKCELLHVLNDKYPKAKIQGIDFSPQSVEYGKNYNLDVNIGDITDVKGKWNLITLTGVLEHQFHINDFLKNLTKLCTDGTNVLIEVPDSEEILERTDAKFMHDIYNDEHVHHFNLYTLVEIMGKYGFKIVDTQFVNRNDWDSMRVVFIYNNTTDRFNNKAIEPIKKLHDKIKDVKSVALYGAGWHTQVIIPSFYKLEVFDAIYDKDIRKQGLKLLGKIIQYPSKDLLMEHDCILISTMSKDSEIEAELIEMGIPKSKIVRIY